MTSKLPVFFHTAQLEFHPKYEWALGHRIKHPESTRRAESIYKEIKKHKDLYEVFEPKTVPLQAIRNSHNYQLLTLYNTASHLKDDEAYYPSVFPQRAKAKPDPTNINHSGFYCFDSGTPLNNKTWLAASWSAASAYSAAKCIRDEKSQYAYAISRPPGHHASRDTYGGYCYFNNAVIAAKLLRKKGRVVVLDVDFHHGNGTQEAFYRDDQVLVISIHGDPQNYFPYFVGFPHETGAGVGAGFNLNIVLPDRCDFKQYSKTLKQTVFPAIKKFEPTYLVVSAGFDTYELDPIGNFALKMDDFHQMGKQLKSLNLPSLIVQEGGYYSKDLGKNVHQFLSAFM